MFRLRRGHHDHDSDAESCNHHDNSTGEVVAASSSQSSSISGSAASSTAAIRRKRVRRTGSSSSSSSSSSSHRHFFSSQPWMKKMRRPETSAIFVLGIAGCVITGCILFVALRLFTAMTADRAQYQHKNAHKNKKNFQGWGGSVYKGPQLHNVHVSGGRRGLQQQQQQSAGRDDKSDGNNAEGGDGENEEEEGDDGYEVLPWNPIYRIPDSYETVGDRSDAYARLRQEMDAILPVDPQRSLQRLQELQRRDANGVVVGSVPHEIIVENNEGDNNEEEDASSTGYDIFNCPDEPPRHYPYEWKLVDEVLHDWPANDIHIPPKVHQGLCVFDYVKDYEKAMTYRQYELPFIVVGDPDVARTVERWAIPGYMEELMGDSVKHRAVRDIIIFVMIYIMLHRVFLLFFVQPTQPTN
jgi:hypothetical protein